MSPELADLVGSLVWLIFMLFMLHRMMRGPQQKFAAAILACLTLGGFFDLFGKFSETMDTIGSIFGVIGMGLAVLMQAYYLKWKLATAKLGG